MGDDDLSGVPAAADAHVVGRERADDMEERRVPVWLSRTLPVR